MTILISDPLAPAFGTQGLKLIAHSLCIRCQCFVSVASLSREQDFFVLVWLVLVLLKLEHMIVYSCSNPSSKKDRTAAQVRRSSPSCASLPLASGLFLFPLVLAATELRFPPVALTELHSDCLDLCRKLLRQNPVEQLTFKEFFDHNFLQEPRSITHVEQPLLHEISTVKQLVITASDDASQSPANETALMQRNNDKSTTGSKGVVESTSTILSDKQGRSIHGDAHFSKQPQVSCLMESIEKGYVLVNPHSESSLEAFSDYFEASATRVSIYSPKTTNVEIGVGNRAKDPSFCADGLVNSKSNELEELAASTAFSPLSEVHRISSLCPSNRLELLHLYVQILAELSDEKYNTWLYLESFAVELVVLAIWKKALEICNYWHGNTSANETRISRRGRGGDVPTSQTEPKIDFGDPSSVSSWAKQGFIVAVDCAERLSCHIQNMDDYILWYKRGFVEANEIKDGWTTYVLDELS
ncbi:hypothetical protein RIF29_32878 [Crotalaria pallida]|uniref:ATG1a/b/c MIT domain-containing protein n=1 Tax=Crotalaria pallida TaxID=3830 RepID=A0AAN9ED20_CROPI